MKTVRVSKNMFYSLKTKRYACGKKYVYHARRNGMIEILEVKEK